MIPFTQPSDEDVQEFRNNILGWFSVSGRNFPWRSPEATVFQKVIAEVLLQRSRADSVASFYSVFISRFPTWDALAASTVEEIEEVLRPIGLWRRRATSLSRLASEMRRRNGEFPRNRDELELLPGVGQYIANSILLFAFGEPQPLLDINMARVLDRYFKCRTLADIRFDASLQGVAKKVVCCGRAADVNWAILDLGSLICRANKMAHHECCLRDKCRHFNGLSEK